MHKSNSPATEAYNYIVNSPVEAAPVDRELAAFTAPLM